MEEHILLNLIFILLIFIAINFPNCLFFFKVIYADTPKNSLEYGRLIISTRNETLALEIERVFSNPNLSNSSGLNQLERIGREHNLYLRSQIITTVMNGLRNLE